jgi:hypothetical protein
MELVCSTSAANNFVSPRPRCWAVSRGVARLDAAAKLERLYFKSLEFALALAC